MRDWCCVAVQTGVDGDDDSDDSDYSSDYGDEEDESTSTDESVASGSDESVRARVRSQTVVPRLLNV